MLNFLDSTLHGGVTTAISAGEVHLPGRPKTACGNQGIGGFGGPGLGKLQAERDESAGGA